MHFCATITAAVAYTEVFNGSVVSTEEGKLPIDSTTAAILRLSSLVYCLAVLRA